MKPATFMRSLFLLVFVFAKFNEREWLSQKNHETLLEPCLLFAVNKIAIKQLFDDQ